MTRFGYRAQPLINYLPSFIAGALLPFAFAPYEYYFLAFPLIAILFYAWTDPSPRNAFFQGWAFGSGMFLTGVYWVYNSMHVFGHIPSPLSALLTAIFAIFLGLFPGVAGWIANRWFTGSEPVRLVLVFPALWVLLEWIRGWFLTGFPWLNLGYSQVEQSLGELAPLFGVYGVSWMVAFLSGLLVLLVIGKWLERVAVLVGMVAIGAGIFFLQGREWTEPAGPAIRVTLVQGNTDQDQKWNPEYREEILQHYLDLTRPSWKNSDLIVWPETAIPAFYHQVEPFVEALDRLAREQHTDMLVGIVTRHPETREYFNSMMSLGSERIFYSKRHLVPFGEYIPLQSLLSDLLDIMGLPMSGFSSGGYDQQPLPAGGYKAGITICYEIAFVEEILPSMPEAHYLVNVSNNTWFGDSSAPHQQLQMARMRARETERFVLSATNNGISAIVNYSGGITAASPQFQQHVLHGEIQPRKGATPFVQWGNWPVIVFAVICCLAGFLLKKNSRSPLLR